MLRVHLVQAKQGMVLAAPIYHPRRHDTVLLCAGMRLDARSIARLRELELKEVWINYPSIRLVAEHLSPAMLGAQAELTHRISEALDTVARGAHARLEYIDYRGAIIGLMERLVENPHAATFLRELADEGSPALRHASNVCIHSLLMGLKLSDYIIAQRSRVSAANARDVTNLGVGAMMHDIGMLRLDPATLRRWNETGDETDAKWRKHVVIGYEMIQGFASPTAAAAVLHHHQKFDGTGFPSRRRHDDKQEVLSGTDIHIFARIIGAADLFDRIRHPAHSPGGEVVTSPSIPVVRALRRLREHPYSAWLDPMCFKALLTVVPPYPPGTLVKLSDGRAAVVVEWFPVDPCRPRVKTIGDIARDFDNPRFEPVSIDLRREPFLSIVEADGEDVSADNFYPESPTQFDLGHAERAIFNAAEAEPDPARNAPAGRPTIAG